MNRIKPYWSLIIEAMAKDYQDDNISWKKLFKDIFIDNSNIYSLMYRFLVHVGIDPDVKINYIKTLSSIAHLETTYEIVEHEGETKIKILSNNKKYPINHNDVDKTLDNIGYKIIE